MFENNNNMVIKKLAKKSLQANKNRNLFAILAIVITTILFTSVFTLGMNNIKTIEIATMKQVGTSAHGGFEGLTEDEYKKIIKHPMIKEYGRAIFLTTATNEVFKSKGIEIRYADEKCAKLMFLTPTTGKLPKSKYEIAMPTWVLDMLDVPHKLGSNVQIEYEVDKVKYSKNFILSGFWDSDKNISPAGMALVSYDFIEEAIKDIDIETILTNSDHKGPIDLEVKFDNSLSIEKKLQKVAKESGVDLKSRYGVNWAYTTTKIVNLEGFVTFLVIIFLILISGYLLIYNIFFISVMNDIKYFGLLKTIGTSSRQLKKIIKRQAFTLALTGIPMGLFLGYIIGLKLTPLLMSGDFYKNNIGFSTNPIIFIGSTVFTLITVFLSCNKPGKIASKISPIEAIRYTGVSTNSKRKEKLSTHGSKIYKMAFSNIFRNKTKTIIVIMSLSTSLIILNFVVTLINGFDIDVYLQNIIRGDFVIGNSTYHTHYNIFDEQPTLSKEICDDIEKKEYVDRIDRVYFYKAQAKIKEVELRKLKDEKKKISKEDKNRLLMINNIIENKSIDAQIYGLDEGWFDIYGKNNIREGKFDVKKFKTGRYVLVDGRESHYNAGDNVTLKTLDGKEKTFEVMAVVDALYIYDVKYSWGMSVKVYMTSNSFIDIVESPVIMSAQIFAKDGKLEFLDDYIKGVTYSTPDLEYRAKSEYIDEYKEFVSNFSTIGLSLSFIIAIIGVVNFINTILTSIVSRKHEFALLQIVGMTKKQLRKMIIYEGLYYGVITTFIVITVGTVIVQYGVKSLGGPMPHFIYKLRIIPTLTSTFIMIIISFIIPIICYRSVEKDSIIKKIRENVY